MRIALFYTASCYSGCAFQGYQDGTLRLFWEMASCSLALCAALAQVFTQPLFEETIDESVESLHEPRFIVFLVRYHCYTHLP